MIYLISIHFFVLSATNFADKPSTCNHPEDLTSSDLSVKFLFGLLLSNSTKISFSNSSLISEIVLLFTAKMSNTLCWPIFRETKVKVFSFRSHLTSCISHHISLHYWISRQEFSRKNFPHKNCGAKSTRSRISYPYSQGKHFFSSTSWVYRRVPIQLKFLNPAHYP